MASLYWAITTITSIGYGDIHPTAGNASEQIVALLLMLTAGMLWGHVLGTFCGVIATFNPDLTAFREMMDDLERFMSTEGLPTTIRIRLREYFHESEHIRASGVRQRLLSLMPPQLKHEVAYLTTAQVLEDIWFLRGSSHHFLVQLSVRLHAMVFAPSDATPTGYLYVIHRGIALYRAKVLSKGKVWGEDVIMRDQELWNTSVARAMNYLEVYFITRAELLDLSENYPETNKQIRRCAARLALTRCLPKMARERLRESGAKVTHMSDMSVNLLKGHIVKTSSALADTLEKMSNSKDAPTGGTATGISSDVVLSSKLRDLADDNDRRDFRQQQANAEDI